MDSADDGRATQPDPNAAEPDASPGPTTPSGASGTTEPLSGARNRRRGLILAAYGLAVVLALGSLTAALTGTQAGQASESPTITTPSVDGSADENELVVAPQLVTAQDLAKLPVADTFATVAGAPLDPAPAARTAGKIAHPSTTIAIYATPGGRPIAALPAQQRFADLATETNVPIVAEQPGWAQILLPSRPNSSTGWIYLDDPAVTTEHSRFRIDVDRKTFTLDLYRDDAPIGHWTIGVGKAGAVTPPGRTFILASILDNGPKPFSPIVMPLGTHSATHLTFGAGPGTVGVHTWPTDNVYGRASSDGCVRVPRDALDVISKTVPPGSVVEIA
ncbi:L,D-transpeptidase [Amycolatopsis sp. NPDC051758]|uniref:L,D-transpeptidase n=1 Tax=Amycolatopsis sp. NPDC051758 TaxID=3363935 RepID=UPI0037BA1306